MSVSSLKKYTDLLKAKWIKFVVSLLALAVTLTAGFNSITEFLNTVIGYFPRQERLKVIEARLQPFRMSTQVKYSVDDLFLLMTVRNYGSESLMIVSANVDVHGSKQAGKGEAGSKGICIFGQIPNDNNPLTVKPGDTVSIMIGSAIRLNNFHNIMETLPLTKIHVRNDGDIPTGIYETSYVDTLNKTFSNYYGGSTEIVANIFTGADGEKHTFHFPLAQGRDFFSNDGALQHDWLIGRWIQPSARGLTPGNKDCTTG